MNNKEIINTENAPEAIGPYSQAVSYNGTIYCSGQISIDPVSNEIVGEDAREQALQVLKNLGEVLRAAGSSFDNVLKCSIYLSDMDDFAIVNEIYGSFFVQDPPARETVAVKTLPKNVFVEISCIAIG